MARFADIPGVQLVPAAIGMAVDHVPEAQRWKEELSAEQDHSPSSVQAPDWAPAVELVPLATGEEPLAADDGEEAPAAPEGAEAAEVAAGIGETTAVDVEPAAPEAKTPPAAEEVAAMEDAADGAAAGAEAAAGDVALPPAALAYTAQVFFTRFTPMLPFWTDAPGSGYTVSASSTVTQSLTLTRLATNIGG